MEPVEKELNRGGERHVLTAQVKPRIQPVSGSWRKSVSLIHMWSGAFPSHLMDDKGKFLPAFYPYLKLWEMWLLTF